MKSKRNMWKMKLNTATLVLLPAAVGINFIGKLFAQTLKLPLWLDSIGTCLAAILAGPIAGGLSGAINNIIYGFMDPVSFVYALTSAGIGIVVGMLAKCGMIKNIKGAVVTGLAAGFVAVVISTPLNMVFWGGMTGNVWGDTVFAWASAKDIPMLIASAMDEIVVDLPDKIAVLLVVFGILKGLPKSLTSLYNTDDTLESLD